MINDLIQSFLTPFSTYSEDNIDVWVNMENCLNKFIDAKYKKIVTMAMKSLKKTYGENPTETEVRMMVT